MATLNLSMLLRPKPIEFRPQTLLRQQYEIEKELANRLRQAPATERKEMYRLVYDELYQRVPHHPQLTRKASAEGTQRAMAPQIGLLGPYIGKHTTLLEIGPGDCSLALAIAHRVKQIYGLDVSVEITQQSTLPPNFTLMLYDGVTIPLPADSIDVAYSNQLMEHLHPEDATEQLAGIYRALKPHGVYICVTPNRLSGPHDVSRFFDSVATGFHLKEYTVRELRQLFKRAGFRNVELILGWGSKRIRVPALPVACLESALDQLPCALRRRLGLTLPFRAVLGICLIGTK